MNADRQTHSDDDMALDLGGLLRAVGRALRWLLPLTLFVAAAVFIGLQFVAPKYLGQARILIESSDGKFPGASRGVEEERALLDSEGVASQAQLLMSADLARRVAQKLDLAAVPEFDARENASLVGDLLASFGLGNVAVGNSEEERVLKHYYENLEIFRLEGSRVIAIDYTSEDPVLAARVANAIVDEYLSLQSRAKRETTELASAALQPQIVELRKEVQAARQAVADFRARADLLIGSDNIPLNQQQLAETSSDYSAAQAAKAEAQAKADLIREILNSGASLETASDVLNSSLIQRLRERQVELQSNIAELSITLLPNHPQLKALQSQLSDYDRQIRGEARKVLQGLENDAKVANQQAQALENRLESLKTAAAKSNADQARLSELEREANAKAVQLDQLLLSYQEADSRLRAQVLPADARIISQASVPVEPDSPKIMSTTIVATLVTFILGCTIVLMREFLSGNALYRMNEGAGTGARNRGPAGESRRASADRTGERFGQDRARPQATFGYEAGFTQTVANYGMDTGFGGSGTPDRSRMHPEPGDYDDQGLVGDRSEDHPVLAAAVPGSGRQSVPEEARGRRRSDLVSRQARYGHDDATDLEAMRTPDDDHDHDHGHDQDWATGSAGDRGDNPEAQSGDTPKAAFAGAAGGHRADDLDAGPELATTTVADVSASGRIVVLSVDDDGLSHGMAFDLVRKAAKSGKSAVIMEVFPEHSDPKAAEGFSDIVAGTVPFAKVVYRDAETRAHIIEAGRQEITDEMVQSERFKLALDAIRSTYEAVVIDLGAIDGTLASARMLSFADRVLIAATSPDNHHELQSAANLLAFNTGARVEVVIGNEKGPGPRRNDDGHAA